MILIVCLSSFCWYLQSSYHAYFHDFISLYVYACAIMNSPYGLLIVMPIYWVCWLGFYWVYPISCDYSLVDLSWLGSYCLLSCKYIAFCQWHVEICFFVCFIFYFYLFVYNWWLHNTCLECSTWGTFAGCYQSMLQYCS